MTDLRSVEAQGGLVECLESSSEVCGVFLGKDLWLKNFEIKNPKVC